MRFDWIRAGLRIAIGLGLLAAAGCRSTHSGFIVPEAEARDTVSTVAIARIFVPDVTEAPAELRTLVETQATQRLEAAGLKVVDTSVWDATWRQSADDLGGVIDRATRAVDEKKFEQVRDAVFRELRSRHGVDAVAYFAVEVVDTYGVLEEASACGGLTPVYWSGRWSGSRATLVRTACLKLLVVDPSNRPLYGLRYPIEGIETIGRQTRATRPKGETLRDPALILEALARILKPLEENERGGD
jgi:hypothetical protein